MNIFGNLVGNLGNTLRKNSLPLFLSMLLPTFSISNSVMAAEQVNTSYLALKISIPISALESYAKSGIIDDKIAKYYQYIPPDKLQKLRQILLQSILISPPVATQFLHTPQGEFFLQKLSKGITNKSHSSDAEIANLRQALIAACGEPEGLNLLNLLRKYPQSNINIDLAATWQISQQLQTIIDDTEKAIALIQQEAKKESSLINFPNLSSLPNTPITTFKKQTITFFDSQRQRQLVTDIYIPDLPHPAPVIIISHGLGLDSSNFRYLANYLSAHGFAVIIPNHPHQNTSLANNSKYQILESNEFKDRPLDIKYILDQLELHPRFHQHLNLKQVGILGQSFGGYTALALAGAKINFKQLKQDCHPKKLNNSWNMSLLLQCRALELSDHDNDNLQDNLQDPRIKAVIAINPISSSIFGKSGLSTIKTPIMIFSSSKDTVAPALSEQILPFSWLNHAQKYLVILVGATHFSAIGNSNPKSKQLPLPPEMVGNASQTHHYIKTLSLPFFQGYVSEKSQYLDYLNSAYAQKIANKSLELNLITSLHEINIKSSRNITHKKQNSPIPYIVKFGFWMLDIGISIIHVLTFSHR